MTTWKRLIGSGATLVALAGISACGDGDAEATPPAASSSEGGSDATEFVCDDFAKFIRDGRPADQRSEVVSDIGELVADAEPNVQDAYGTLANTVNGTVGSQQIADDTFAQACFDAGWEG